MKKNILALVIALFAVIQTMAQTYDNLWKQADAYRQKDLPKSEIGVMRKISAKASASKDYGLSLIHISEPTRHGQESRMPSCA